MLCAIAPEHAERDRLLLGTTRLPLVASSNFLVPARSPGRLVGVPVSMSLRMPGPAERPPRLRRLDDIRWLAYRLPSTGQGPGDRVPRS